MKENKKDLHEELLSVALHPDRISYLLSKGYKISEL
jgi:hypothetical protein